MMDKPADAGELISRLKYFAELPMKTRQALEESGMFWGDDPAAMEPQPPKDVAKSTDTELSNLYDDLVEWYDNVSKKIILATTEVEAAKEQIDIVEAYLTQETRKDKKKYGSAEERNAAITLDERRCVIVANRIFWKNFLEAQKLRLSQITQKRDRIYREIRRREATTRGATNPFGSSIGSASSPPLTRGASSKLPYMGNLKEFVTAEGGDSGEGFKE